MFSRKNKVELDQQVISTLISEGCVFDGNMKAPAYVRIEGTINGDVTIDEGLILGEKGTVRIGGTAVNKVEHWEFAEPLPEDDRIRAMESNPPNVYGYGHEGYYRNVLAVLRGEATADTDGRAGRKSLELILGIYESARTGSDVPLPLKA